MRSLSTLLPRRQPRSTHAKRRHRRISLLSVLILLMLAGFGYHQVRGYLREPQAILVLGGSTTREEFAADFAKRHPQLSIWVSSGSNPEYSEWVFANAGIERDRVHLDYQAVDTVTNFTTLVDDFQDLGIDSVYLITSDYHMRRAKVIGGIVLWSRGIDFRPIAVPSGQPPESIDKILRDAARSVLWVVTGHTGSSLGKRFRTGS